jgi:hypothetical protein
MSSGARRWMSGVMCVGRFGDEAPHDKPDAWT